MRSPCAFLLCLWLFQLVPQGAWPQTMAMAGAGSGPVQIPPPPGSLDASVANLLRDNTGEPPFNTSQSRIPDSDLAMLTQNGYRLQHDGTVWLPYSDTPVGRSEMSWLLQELLGRQRLKAMLQLNLIFNKYGYKNLPDSALADVRRISRQNWAVLPKDIRSDLRQYFTAYELDSMNQHVPMLKSPTLWLNPELPPLATAPTMPRAIFVAPAVTTPQAASPAPAPAPQAFQTPAAPAAVQAVPQMAAAPLSNSIPAPAAATNAARPAPATPVPPAPASASPAGAARGFAAAQPAVQPRLQPVLPSEFASLPMPQVMKAMAPAAPSAPEAPAPVTTAAPAAPTQMPAVANAAPPTATPSPQTAVAAAPTTTAAAAPPTAAAVAPAATSALPAPPAPNFSIQPAPAAPAEASANAAIARPVAASSPADTAIRPPSAAFATATVPPFVAPGAIPPAPMAAQAQAPAAPDIGEYPDISKEAAEKFLADAPYGHEVAELLKLIADHAPDDLRRCAFGVLARFLPQIVIDPARSGEELRVATHKLNEDPYQAAATLIVLSRGPLVLRERKFIFEAKTFLIPSSQEFYGDRGATLPALQAQSHTNPPLYEKSAHWGRLEEFSDGSERLKFSQTEMAGTLLYQLLKLDARLRRWDADLYRTELRSRSAQFRFYYKFRQDTAVDPQLSLDLKTEYAQWLDRPQDYADFVLQTLSAPRVDQALSSLSGTLEQRSAWSRRHDLSVLSEAGLALSDEAQKFLSGPPPAAPDLSQENAGVAREIQALSAESSIGTIWLAEEQRFREELNAKH